MSDKDREIMTSFPRRNYNEMKAIKPSPGLSALARSTGAVKEFLNELTYGRDSEEGDPLLFGSTEKSDYGAGDLLFGQGPEALDQWAHGFPPLRGSGQTLRLKPEALEIAALPTFGALSGVKALAKPAARVLTKTLGREGASNAVDLERRAFLKNSGVLGAGAAVATVVPSVLTKALSKTPIRVANKVAIDVATTFRGVKESILSHVPREIERSMVKGKNAKAFGDGGVASRAQGVKLQKAYDDFLEMDWRKMYTPKEQASMEDLFKRLPSNLDPEEALLKGWGYHETLPNVGSKYFDNMGGVYADDLSESAARIAGGKSDDAYAKLQDIPVDEIDLWIAGGPRPKGISAEQANWLDPEFVYLRSNVFSMDGPTNLMPDAMRTDPMSMWYDHLMDYNPDTMMKGLPRGAAKYYD